MPVRVVAPDQHDLLVVVGQPRELRAEARAERRDADRALDVHVVELQVRPDVHEQRALVALDLHLMGIQRGHLHPARHERPAVHRDDPLEVWRLGPEPGDRLRHELVLLRDRQRRVVLLLEADRRADLHVHARAAAHRAAEVRRPHLAVVGQRQQALVHRAEDRPRPARSTARSVRATSPTNRLSPLSTAHGSGLRAVSISRKAVCSGRWPGVCSARTSSEPSRSSQPSSNGSCS